jgi:hypothetical protein
LAEAGVFVDLRRKAIVQRLRRGEWGLVAAIAPAIAGPHVKPKLRLTAPSGVSESGTMLLASSANQEMQGSP